MFQTLVRLESNCLDLSQTVVISVNQGATEGLRGHDLCSLIKIRIHDLQTGSHGDKLMGKIFPYKQSIYRCRKKIYGYGVIL